MDRYSVIDTKLPREFVLLQGKGCRWGKCSFCNYHTDTSENPFLINKEVLQRVTGVHGVLDVINSGSAMELDNDTMELLKQVVRDKNIHTLWFEAHYMYRNRLASYSSQFAPAKVKFRCGIESFDPRLRKEWNKGVPKGVTAQDVARYFNGVCLLCCTVGDTRERILNDISIAQKYFEYFSVNLFCNNGTVVERDEELAEWFVREVFPKLNTLSTVEVLVENTDLGVG
ncbi:MAG: hypothetical protein IKJ31_04385 [Bacteroidaceae bacterium]|nr:hypothetical protein [Bacteroidaceae bacterium]